MQATVRHSLRALCFDLENRGAAYWFDGNMTAEITAMGWKFDDEPKVHTLMLRSDGYFEGDDGIRVPYGMAYVVFRDVLCQADLVYGHNIRRHDLPLFQAGLLRQQLPPLPELLTSDTLKDLPRRKDLSASLENLAAMYGFDIKKQSMSIPQWEEANRLTDKGVELSRSRVSSDVLLQEKLRKKLLELNLLKSPRRWTP